MHAEYMHGDKQCNSFKLEKQLLRDFLKDFYELARRCKQQIVSSYKGSL